MSLLVRLLELNECMQVRTTAQAAVGLLQSTVSLKTDCKRNEHLIVESHESQHKTPESQHKTPGMDKNLGLSSSNQTLAAERLFSHECYPVFPNPNALGEAR